ncbi:MHYT domain-containing protein [Streptomyces cavernae]|uniref:MHYT domain-containing protein n=1 Tax=Streptomyces cavernae TaxID=2259034 RepID=UPI000FEB65DC|nr:MHYT domain-containing protein [Streptomyces cavernae]
MHTLAAAINYGAVTPVAAYMMACLGSALGLRSVARSLRSDNGWRAGWLALGAASLGCGIWTMHFIAMAGFEVEGSRVSYDIRLTLISLGVAIAVVAVGIFAVGYRGAGPVTLPTAGVFTGLGVAAMHYTGMAAMRLHGHLEYDTTIVVLSVVIAVVASTAALWAVVSIRSFLASIGASLVMGVAVTGMHYTGMLAVTAHADQGVSASIGPSPVSLLLPMLIGPIAFLILATAVVMFDPMLVLGDDGWNNDTQNRSGAPVRTEQPDLFQPSDNFEHRGHFGQYNSH